MLWKVFFALTIIIGVVAWLFVLAQQSRRAAEDETRRQTTLLIQEIDAHKRTDAELQRAKEVAESANLAKSRYVVGLSHELRSPLNAISGYAQLLEQDSSLQPKPRDQVRVVRRSADHLSGLIDGILDISQDRGRPALSVARRGAPAANSSISWSACSGCRPPPRASTSSSRRPTVLPVVVYTDEKRLRQILINLLSNAIKFTAARQRAVRRALSQPGRRIRGRPTPARASRPTISNASSRRSSAARSASRSRRPERASASPSAGCSPA